jgi:hypothetical protein
MEPLTVGTVTCGRITTKSGEHVATEFLYVIMIPLFPVGGVVEATDSMIGGWRICPIHAMSVIAAYLRLWLAVAAAFAFLVFVVGLCGEDVGNKLRNHHITVGVTVYCVAGVAWLWSMFVLGADPARSQGLSPGGKCAVGLACLVGTLLVACVCACLRH